MKLAIVGSRNYPNRSLVDRVVQAVAQKAPDTVIVSGGLGVWILGQRPLHENMG